MSADKSETLKETVMAEREKGNVVLRILPGQIGIFPLDGLVEQHVDGLLYDLNRSEEVVLTFINDPKWINDFAVAQVIRKLVEQRDAAHEKIARIRLAANKVVWYDWSGNDADAVLAVEDLRRALKE